MSTSSLRASIQSRCGAPVIDMNTGVVYVNGIEAIESSRRYQRRSRSIDPMGTDQVSDAEKCKSVRCYEQQVTIPTYPVQDADPNPMFLEKRVYQGSSGKVYPNPFTDRVALRKVDKLIGPSFSRTNSLS